MLGAQEDDLFAHILKSHETIVENLKIVSAKEMEDLTLQQQSIDTPSET